MAIQAIYAFAATLSFPDILAGFSTTIGMVVGTNGRTHFLAKCRRWCNQACVVCLAVSTAGFLY